MSRLQRIQDLAERERGGEGERTERESTTGVRRLSPQRGPGAEPRGYLGVRVKGISRQ